MTKDDAERFMGILQSKMSELQQKVREFTSVNVHLYANDCESSRGCEHYILVESDTESVTQCLKVNTLLGKVFNNGNLRITFKSVLDDMIVGDIELSYCSKNGYNSVIIGLVALSEDKIEVL